MNRWRIFLLFSIFWSSLLACSAAEPTAVPPPLSPLAQTAPTQPLPTAPAAAGQERETAAPSSARPPFAAETRADGAARLTSPPPGASDQNPAFSPDGTQLVFTRFENGYNTGPAGLFRLDLTTGEIIRLTPWEDQDNVNLPGAAWSATRNRIVFASDRAEADDVWQIAPDGSDFRRITTHEGAPWYIEPSWSPDGEWIVFEADADRPDDRQQGSIWKVRADGTALTVLTDGPALGVDDRQPNWSPAGDRILFQRRDPGSDDWDIYTMAPDGSDARLVTDFASSDTDASWSPDGRFIVYSSDYGDLPTPNIFVIPAAGGEPVRVTFNETHEDGAPSWSPDGRFIAFESHPGEDEEMPSRLWFIAAPPLDGEDTAVPSPTISTTSQPDPLLNSGHPRLWVRASDLPRLRSWAVASNPVYQDGLAVLAARAKAEMDAGNLPGGDSGGITWEQYPNEMYAMLFAFMSLIENDPAARADYAQRARALLMYVVNEAAKGAAADQPFRDPAFSTYDRSRWWGEGFPLTVDWIYPYLSTQDKATIRQVFLRWADENMNAGVTAYNHPEPVGVINDPVLISDTMRVRWSANNYYLAHMRQIGLMSMALDPADDAGGQLGAYLDSATGAWLYVVDHMLRTEAAGGFSPEGWLYGPDSLGFAAQFMLGLYTAGEADTAGRGPQVDWSGNPFWDAMIPALLHSLSPRLEASSSWLGDAYRPAWYGDGQHYWAPDFIGVFGPMGVYDDLRGNASRLEAIRWIQTHTPPGGASALTLRVSDAEVFRDAILYFLLFDPAAAAPSDPHAGLGTTYYAPGIGRILARTDWGTDAAMLSYLIGWMNIDHQLAEGNQFGFYRQGEWLTKGRVGWDGSQEPWGCNIGRSDYHNNLALENDPPNVTPDDFLQNCYLHGSQYLYTHDGDGKLLARSFGVGYVYALGEATDLYNASELQSADILHASRSLFWLQPDVVVVYDRATSATSGRFKRFWLNLPAQPAINGNRATAVTPSGQQLFVTSLLPTNGEIAAVAMEPFPDEVAEDEPMQYRLRVEASGGPADARFLHVLEGADAGASATAVSLVQSMSGTPFDGAVVGETAVLFPANLDDPFNGVTYRVPAGVRAHYVTGLTPGDRYSVITQTVGAEIEVTINAGGETLADSGGVLSFGDVPSLPARLFLPVVVSVKTDIVMSQ